MNRWILLAGAAVLALGLVGFGVANATSPWLLASWADRVLDEGDLPEGAELLARREATHAAILASLGDAPAPEAESGLVTSTEPMQTPAGADLTRANFFLPDGGEGVALLGFPEADTPRGLVVALHQTTDVGMKEVMGLEGIPQLAYGRALIDAGYVVVAPEGFTTGERVDAAGRWLTGNFYVEHPDWSAMGKMLSDHQAALTAASTLYAERYGEAPQCISAVGHSLGAHNALFLAVFDDRIDAVVANAGFERIVSDDDAVRWSRDGGFIYMPELHDATRGLEPLAWDWEDVLAQVYPRGAFISQGLQDPIFTHEISVAQTARAVEAAYASGGHAERFDADFWYGGHEYPERLQDKAGAFIAARCAEAP